MAVGYLYVEEGRGIEYVRPASLRWRVRNLPHRLAGSWKLAFARLFRIAYFHGSLYLRVCHADGEFTDYGLVSRRVVTTAGVNAIVDAFQNTVEVENFKYHGFGTGTNAEATSDTALQTELTTQYATDNTRPTGTQTEGASANIYRSVATLDPDATVTITEHGIFTAASGGTLLDRTVFAAVNLDSATDTLEATYELTIAAGA